MHRIGRVMAIRSQICLCSGHINGGQHVAYLTCSITIAVYEGKLKLYRVNLL
jgi:1,4-dihydroxy-2-naphthoyl-CoA synthase